MRALFCCSLFAVNCLLGCVLFLVRFVLIAVRCCLFVIGRLLVADCKLMMIDVCCLLFVVGRLVLIVVCRL